MTKKHYIAIASIFKGYLDIQINECDRRDLTSEECDALDQATYDLSSRLANYFQQENPRFDRERFLEACGVETDEVCNNCGAEKSSQAHKTFACNK